MTSAAFCACFLTLAFSNLPSPTSLLRQFLKRVFTNILPLTCFLHSTVPNLLALIFYLESTFPELLFPASFL